MLCTYRPAGLSQSTYGKPLQSAQSLQPLHSLLCIIYSLVSLCGPFPPLSCTTHSDESSSLTQPSIMHHLKSSQVSVYPPYKSLSRWIHEKLAGSASRQLFVLALCFLMKLDGVLKRWWKDITVCKFSSPVHWIKTTIAKHLTMTSLQYQLRYSSMHMGNAALVHKASAVR